ncbi:MAG: MoxR family ATPase [Myxococcales bacterium]|nr:MoxR family ATPase [Myxococcales bacterium]
MEDDRDLGPTRLRRVDGQQETLHALPGGQPCGHRWQAQAVLAVNAALAAQRPLLVRGEPGTGKTQLAHAAAQVLERVLITETVDSRTETRDLKWTMDLVARLAEAQIAGATRQAAEQAEERLKPRRFVQPGPVWWALNPTHAAEQAEFAEIPEEAWLCRRDDLECGVVLLVDEIDKADPSVPNGLLDALGHGAFDVPVAGCDPVVRRPAPHPAELVIFTTNEERALPDAFLRRCLVLELAHPDDEEGFVTCGRAHFGSDEVSKAVLQQAAEQLLADRRELLSRGLSAPGMAEYLDLVRAVVSLGATDEERLTLLSQVGQFFLRKHPTMPA